MDAADAALTYYSGAQHYNHVTARNMLFDLKEAVFVWPLAGSRRRGQSHVAGRVFQGDFA